MNEEKHFLEAINAGEPNADLIYADWLEEQGRPEADEVRDPTMVASCNWSRSLYWSGSGSRYRNRHLSQSGHRYCSRSRHHSYSLSRSDFRSRFRSRSGSRYH